MTYGRKIQRKRVQALGQLSQATQQLSDLNEVLKHLPQVYEKLQETEKLLEAMIGDMEALQEHQELTDFLLKKLLTEDALSQYRAEWQAARGSSE